MTGKRALRGASPLGAVASLAMEPCPLCKRPLPNDRTVDEHHLIPKSEGGQEAFRIHRICHRKIHATLSERVLAARFNTWAELQAQPDIAAFIRWVANKDPSYYDNSRRMKVRD
jgi:hypothetical protein